MKTTPEQAVTEIYQLFRERGAEAYDGEPVSQLAHALQAAQQAERTHATPATVVAAFLHDIGHLLPTQNAADYMDDLGRVDHDLLGADWLAERGFPTDVTQLVRNHVQAKRYLVFRYPVYAAALSEASQQTLIWQGGPMTATEAADFEQNPLFQPIIQIRRWDEAAKMVGLPTPTLDDYVAYTLTFLRQRIAAQ